MQNWRELLYQEYQKNRSITVAEFLNNYGNYVNGGSRQAKKSKIRRQLDNFKAGNNQIKPEDDARALTDLGYVYEDNVSVNETKTTTIETTDVVEQNFVSGTISSDKLIEILPEHINEPAELLKAHGFDPHRFELLQARNSKWQQNSKTDGMKTLYASKITVRPFTSFENYIDEISDYFKDYKSSVVAEEYKQSYESMASSEYLILPMYDFHWGRLPDMENAELFSLEKMKKLIFNNMKEYISRFRGRHFKKVFLVIGQDYFNSAYNGYTSSQSHLQSNAVDTHTMYRTGTELIIDIINMFAERGDPVQVVGSLGNHSKEEEAWLFALIKAYYRQTNEVQVDDSNRPRKYLDLGNSCVGLGHLDKEGKRVFGLMQVEAPELWAKANTRMFIAGHLHHFKVENEMGVELWRIPSATLPDRWTVENGYVLSLPKTMAFVFDEERGLVENHFVAI